MCQYAHLRVSVCIRLYISLCVLGVGVDMCIRMNVCVKLCKFVWGWSRNVCTRECVRKIVYKIVCGGGGVKCVKACCVGLCMHLCVYVESRNVLTHRIVYTFVW